MERDPKTGLPKNQSSQTATIVVPANQSSVVIPQVEIQALKKMNRHERKIWAARKKKLLGEMIDQYVQQAVISTNGKAT